MHALRSLSAGQIAAGVAAYVAAAGGAYLLFAKPPAVGDAAGVASTAGRRATFNTNAPHYDADVESSEAWSSINRLRRDLIAHARGRVVEVGVGTGRNLPLYAPDVRLLAVDNADGMLAVARSKAGALPADRAGGPIEFAVGDVTALGLPSGSVDAVVDTFSLCSYEDPAAALAEMVRVLAPGGRLLLLEHGRSSWAAVNWFLDKYTPAHVARHGCSWNRDMAALVAGVAGVREVEARRADLGTTFYWVGVKEGGAGGGDSSGSGPGSKQLLR